VADKKGFLLRLDEALWPELKGWAEQELRSLNGQIEYILRRALAERRKINAGSADRRITEQKAKEGKL
jgi:hypothetical protein